MKSIEEIKKKRFQFLHKLWKLSGGDELKFFVIDKIGNGLGFDRETTDKIGQYLSGEGLINFEAFDQGGGLIRITHRGICEIEEALTNPDKPTDHFLPVNIISVGLMIGSQIQQASPEASQVVIISENKYQELKEIIKPLKESIDKLGLQMQQKSDLLAEIQTIEAQMSSSKPKKTIITECVHSIRNILEGVASNAIAYGFIQLIERIPRGG